MEAKALHYIYKGVIIMRKLLVLIGVACTIFTMVGCNETKTELTTEDKDLLCVEYLIEHGWNEDEIDKIEFEDSQMSDEYYIIKIYTNGYDDPTVIDNVYYD